MKDIHETPNPVLREHVTSGAFQMTLSKSMLACLTAIYHEDRAYMACVRDSVTANAGLKRRGLIYYIDPEGEIAKDREAGKVSDHHWRYPGEWIMCQPFGRFTKLTRAGEIMCLLLIEAGLLTERVIVREPDRIEVP